MRLTEIAGLLPLVIAVAACQQTGAPARVETPPEGRGEIAFELAGAGGAALMVPVHLNGQGPFDFVLDTGATVTCVEQAIAAELGLPPARGVLGVGAGVGGSGRMALVEIDSIRVGEAAAFDLTACSLDLLHTSAVGLEIHGLLGLNFLREFHVTIDFDQRLLVLR